MTLPYPPPWQDLATLAEHICVGESTIERWVKEGRFPPARKVGGKNLWQWREVDKFLARSQEMIVSLADERERLTNATRHAFSKD
jgi:predicted DNA-binding transcriptional regulator AlpA